MKKYLVAFTLIFYSMQSFSQVFYNSYNSASFKQLLTNGISYIKTGKEDVDKIVEESLSSLWKCTSYKTIDPNKDFSLKDDDIILAQMKFILKEGGTALMAEDILCLVPYSTLKRKNKSKYDIIGYVTINGFNQKPDVRFLDLAVSGLNEGVTLITKKELTGDGAGFYLKMSNALNINATKLKNKTLLIVGKTSLFVDKAALDKNNIKYKEVSDEDYDKLTKEERKNYCLLCFGYNSYTDVSIFDLEDKSVIFTWHYLSAHAKFDKKDIEKIIEHF